MKILTLILILLTVSLGYTYGQDDKYPTTQGKIEKLLRWENKVHYLPYDEIHLNQEIYPEVNAQRDHLAPHYPDVRSLEQTREAIYAAFTDWYESYPSEYSNYLEFLQLFIRKHTRV